MSFDHASTLSKALQINLEQKIYGTFAEIGAGQEVARFFFQAGKASQTVAKTISAYDMIYSDEIYGKEPHGRYVCESRLLKMLTKEYSLLERRLQSVRGERTTFFAFSNTVATGDLAKRTPHGWMGVRFQIAPGGPFNDLYLHVRMLDGYRLQQQEALGVLGVNLLHAAFYHRSSVDELVSALISHLKKGQIALDLIVTEGPALAQIDGEKLHLELVRLGLAQCVLVNCQSKNSLLQDLLYGKDIAVTSDELVDLPHSFPRVDYVLQNQAISPQAHMSCPVSQDKRILPLIHRFESTPSMKTYFRKFGVEKIHFILNENEFFKLLEKEPLLQLGTLFDGSTTVHLQNPQDLTSKAVMKYPELKSVLEHLISQKSIQAI